MIGRGKQAQKSTRSRDRTEVEAQKTVEAHNEVQKVEQGILSQKHQKHQQQDKGSHNVSDMKRIETCWVASKKSEATEKRENLRLKQSTERSRLRGPRRVQVHVHDARGVDGEGCDEGEIHVRAETELSESHRCEVAPIQKMARKAAEELKSAELKNKVQTVEKSLQEQQHINNRRYSKQFNSSSPEKKPGRLQSIPEYVIKKGRPHGHRYWKLPENKEYHLAHNLKKRCIKRRFTGIHDRFLRDHDFRKRMLEHDRDEDVCLKWDDLAEQDFTYRMSEPEYFRNRQNWWWISLNKSGRSGPLRNRSDFNDALSTLNRYTENLEDNNSGQCHTGSTSHGNRHRVLPPPGGNGENPGGLPENSMKVNERGSKQRLTIERGNPLSTDLLVKPQTKGFREFILFCCR